MKCSFIPVFSKSPKFAKRALQKYFDSFVHIPNDDDDIDYDEQANHQEEKDRNSGACGKNTYV
jgi:hypothetical protein